MTKQNSQHNFQPNLLSPADRKHQSRERLMFQIGWLIDNGYPVFVIAKHPGMPGLDKLWRWISASPELRRRYENATDWRRAQLADHVVAMADEIADTSRSGKKLKLSIRKWRTEMERRPESRKQVCHEIVH